MEYLQPIADFVLDQEKKLSEYYKIAEKAIESIFECAKVYKEPIQKEMFVVCYSNGEVMNICNCKQECGYCSEIQSFQEAKEKLLFEDFTFHKGHDKNNPDFWFVKNAFIKIHDYEFEVAKITIDDLANRKIPIKTSINFKTRIGL